MLPMMSLNLIGGLQDAFMEALMCFGAGSCSIEDAHLGAPQEQEIFSDGPVPWTGDKRQLWNESRITALFPAGEDVAEALAMAADSVGLTEMPQYEVVNTEEIDWVQQVQCQFKPIEVAKGLWIIPKWSTPPVCHVPSCRIQRH
jgi:ribosomal protein L11 methylase PrmA